MTKNKTAKKILEEKVSSLKNSRSNIEQMLLKERKKNAELIKEVSSLRTLLKEKDTKKE